MRKSTALIVVAMIGAIAILVTLGTWQLFRLEWKEELISRINVRSAGEPVGLEEMVSLWNKTGDVGYLPVTLTGRFDHQRDWENRGFRL